MLSRFDSCLAFVLGREGGLVFNEHDSGGITNFGVSIHTLSEYKGVPATTDDVKNLTLADARTVYLKLFWERMNLDTLDQAPAIQLAVFDFAVNSGIDSAVRALQNVLIEARERIKADGVLGFATANSVVSTARKITELKLGVSFMRARRMFISRICQRDKSQVAFLPGWIGRTHAVEDAMNALITPQQKGSP